MNSKLALGSYECLLKFELLNVCVCVCVSLCEFVRVCLKCCDCHVTLDSVCHMSAEGALTVECVAASFSFIC